MLKKVRVAVIGIGLIGTRHVQASLKNPDVELLCTVEPHGARREKVRKELGIKCFESCSEMLNNSDSRPEAAIVCTPNETHLLVAKELIAAGVNVLVEKPLAESVESARELVSLAVQAGRKLLVGHHRRFQPYIIAAKKAIIDGDLGRVVAVSGLWTAYKPPGYFETEWRASNTGGGPVLINMVHDVDLLQYMLGPIVRVTAEETIKQRGLPAEEGAAILLRFASGVVGTFILSDAVVSPHSFEQGTGENPMMPKSGQDVYRIFGSEATLSIPDMRKWSYEQAAEKSWTEPLSSKSLHVEPVTPFDAQLAHLVRVIRTGEAPVCSGADALSALEVCLAIRESIATRKAVDIST